MTWGADDLVVRFEETIALDRVSLDVAPREVHAVIGGDGAGKSTLLKVLSGLDQGATGRVRLPPTEAIAYVPASGGVFAELTVDENLEFVAAAYRLRGWRDRAAVLLRAAALDAFGDRLARDLSGGQRRKLAASMALLHEPQLLVLDEVTTGVDPLSRMELWRLVAAAATRGAAVVVATTYLDEAERADVVTLLHRGCCLAQGRPADIVAEVPGSVITTDRPSDPSRAWRLGRSWREWRPDESRAAGTRLRLEDAAIVHELRAERAS